MNANVERTTIRTLVAVRERRSRVEPAGVGMTPA
jgi:hypothetical protein